MKRNATGFTLIEMMVVITIIGILSAIAIPQYSEYVRKSALVEASSTLSDWRVRMEQFYQDNRSYASAGTTCGATVTATADQRFNYTCTAPTNETYLLTATGKTTNKANGFTFTLDQLNQRRTTALPTGFASVATPANCWITNKGATSC